MTGVQTCALPISGIKAINLDDDDKLIGTAITSGDDEILLAASSGKLIRFNESHVRAMGRTERGFILEERDR